MKRLKEIPTNDGETIIENLWNVRTVEKKRLTFQERRQYLLDWVRGHETDLDSSVASIRLQEMHFPYRHGKHDKTCHVPQPWKNGGKRQFEKLNFKGTFGMMNEFYRRWLFSIERRLISRIFDRKIETEFWKWYTSMQGWFDLILDLQTNCGLSIDLSIYIINIVWNYRGMLSFLAKRLESPSQILGYPFCQKKTKIQSL